MVVRSPPELKHAPVFRYNRFFRPALEKFIGSPLTVLAVMREPSTGSAAGTDTASARPAGSARRDARDEFRRVRAGYIKGDRPGLCRCRLAGQVPRTAEERHPRSRISCSATRIRPACGRFLERLGCRSRPSGRNVNVPPMADAVARGRGSDDRKCARVRALRQHQIRAAPISAAPGHGQKAVASQPDSCRQPCRSVRAKTAFAGTPILDISGHRCPKTSSGA